MAFSKSCRVGKVTFGNLVHPRTTALVRESPMPGLPFFVPSLSIGTHQRPREAHVRAGICRWGLDKFEI